MRLVQLSAIACTITLFVSTAARAQACSLTLAALTCSFAASPGTRRLRGRSLLLAGLC